MGFLDGLFERKATRVNAGQAVARAVSGGSDNAWSGYSSLSQTNWDLDRSVEKGYERVIWVFRCVDAIASAQATVPIILKDYNVQEGKTVENKQLHKILNRKSNPYEDAWAFRYRLSGQLLLSPKGAFIEMVKSASGDVVQLYLLDPGSVEPIKDPKKWVSGYKVSRGDGNFDILPPEKIMWLRIKPHMIDPYRQMTPLIAAGLAAETDFLARMFNRNFLKNDGRPGMLISIDGDLSTEDGQEIKAKFDGGYSTAGKTALIEAQGINVVDMSARGRDVQWSEAIQGSKDDILLAFGCPESVLGNASGRCLRASELVHLASGEVKRAEELVGQEFSLLQPSYRGSIVVEAKAEYALKEPIYKITTFSGRTLETNGEHPLYMGLSRNKGPFKRDIFPLGWTSMRDIDAHFTKNDQFGSNTYTEVAIPVHFAQTSQNIADSDRFWSEGERFNEISDDLFTSEINAQTSFLSGLYSAHGRFSQHTSFDIYPPSREYAVKLQRLLLRIGVHSTVTTKKIQHVVSISGKINMFNFLSFINLEGNKKDMAEKVRARLNSDKSREQNFFRSDGLPPGLIWDRVLSVEEIGVDQTVALTVNGDPRAKERDHSYLGLFWEHNTFNNSEGENEQWWVGTMKTHCDAIARGMDILTGEDDDELYLQYDYTTVDVLQRAERRKHDKLAQDLARGAITIDDYRIGTGREPLDVPGTKVLIHPTRLVIGADPADVEAIRALPIIGQAPTGAAGFQSPVGNLTGANGVVGGANDFIQGELSANQTGDPAQTVNDLAARALRSAGDLGVSPNNASPNQIVEITDRIDRLLNRKALPAASGIDYTSQTYYTAKGRLQGALEGVLTAWSNRQLDVAASRLTHTKVRKGTRHWDGEPGNKSLDTDYVVETKEWTDELGTSVFGVIKSSLQPLVPPSRTEELEAISTKVADIVVAAGEYQTSLLARHIGVLDTSGKSIAEIGDTLKPESFDRPHWITDISEKAVARAIVSVDGVLSSFVDDIETKTIKFVRTVAGMRRYGQDKGSIIIRDGAQPLDGLVAMINDVPGYEKVQDTNGNVYYVGVENGEWVVRNPLDNSKMHSDATEEAVFAWLNEKVGGSAIGDKNTVKEPGKPGEATSNKPDSDTTVKFTNEQAADANKLDDEELVAYIRLRQRGRTHAQAFAEAQRKTPTTHKKK